MELGNNQDVGNRNPPAHPGALLRNDHDQLNDQEDLEGEVDILIPRNADGSLDGGVAFSADSTKSTAASCDLVRVHAQW